MSDALPTKDKLPEVALDDLPVKTKDYLIGLHAATGRPIADLIREILNDVSGYEGRLTQ
jgi:hypothetical protein